MQRLKITTECSYPDNVWVLLELFAAGGVVADVAAHSRLGVLPDCRLSSPTVLQGKAKLLSFHRGVPSPGVS